MFFDVKRIRRFTLEEKSVVEFKKAVANYLNEEDEVERFSADDISDEIVKEVLSETIQDGFQEECHGVSFDNYFSSVSLDCSEESVRDAVYEAAALVRNSASEVCEKPETRFFARRSFLINFKAFETVMQELLNDSSVEIDAGDYGTLSIYSKNKDLSYDEDEILTLLSEHLGATLINCHLINDAQEIYFMANK